MKQLSLGWYLLLYNRYKVALMRLSFVFAVKKTAKKLT
ncbi:hypothetical protein RCH33_2106 [Flavobacterium daejeonense]|nr:hypothetical protein RCH33_2106 [Flavobacterium daejeonense]